LFQYFTLIMFKDNRETLNIIHPGFLYRQSDGYVTTKKILLSDVEMTSDPYSESYEKTVNEIQNSIYQNLYTGDWRNEVTFSLTNGVGLSGSGYPDTAIILWRVGAFNIFQLQLILGFDTAHTYTTFECDIIDLSPELVKTLRKTMEIYNQGALDPLRYIQWSTYTINLYRHYIQIFVPENGPIKLKLSKAQDEILANDKMGYGQIQTFYLSQ